MFVPPEGTAQGDVVSGKTSPPIHEDWTTVFALIAERIEQIERKIDALRLYVRPQSGVGSLELMRDDTRLGKLEAWVEVAMRTLATLGLEALLIELDEARGANYDRLASGVLPAGDGDFPTVG
jgi:hypothetical protein